MPPTKKRRLNFNSPPTKTGIACTYLSENYSEITGPIAVVKNGHVLNLYITNNRNVKETVINLRKVIGDQDVQEVSHYSIQRLVKNTLEKFKKLTDAKEMERFKEACADEFALIPATPRPKPAETVTTGEVSQSPVKTRKTAACGNCKVLRNSLRKCIQQKDTISRNRLVTRKQAPKRLNEKLKRRDSTIERLKERYGDSEAAKLKERLKKLSKAAAYSKKKVAALKSSLNKAERTNSKSEADYQNRILELEEEVAHGALKDDFKKEGKTFSDKMRTMVYECIMSNVPTDKIPPLVLSFATKFGVDITAKDIPVRSSVENMVAELGLLSDLQVAEFIHKSTDVTIGFDATTQEGVHVNAIHTTSEHKCLVVALDQLAGGTAKDYSQHIIDSVAHLAHVYCQFHTDASFSDVHGELISHIIMYSI